MERPPITVASEVRRRLDDAGFPEIGSRELVGSVSKVAIAERRFVGSIFWLLIVACLISCLYLLIEKSKVWPSGTLASIFAANAFLIEARWVSSQYATPKGRLIGLLQSPELSVAKTIADDLREERLELLDANFRIVPRRISDNRFFALLLHDDPRLHALARLPWGSFVKGPFYLQATSRPSTLSAKPSIPKAAKPAPPRKSTAKKREYLTSLNEAMVLNALEGFFEDAAVVQINHEMYVTATLSIWRSFISNPSNDYVVLSAVDKAKIDLEKKFKRIALSFPRDTTGDTGASENCDLPEGQAESQNSDAWIRAIAYGTNLKLRARLERESIQPRLAL